MAVDEVSDVFGALVIDDFDTDSGDCGVWR
jgi:hypothetical protein